VTDPAQVTVERYRDAGIALLPPGHAFSQDIDSDLASVLEALSVEPARIHEMAARLLVNYDPAQADEMLPEWEAALDISATGTTAERQGALVSKLIGRTQHSKATFERAAVALGYGQETWYPVFHQPVCVGTSVATTPAVLQRGRWRMKFTPRLDSTNYASDQVLMSWNLGFGGGTAIQFRNIGGAVIQLDVTATDATQTLQLGAAAQLSWSAGAQITLEVNSAAGYIAITGATVLHGPYFHTSLSQQSWRWPPGQLNIGQLYAPLVIAFDGTIDAIEQHSISGIEFKTYDPFVAGECAAGDHLYGDEWANTVSIYVPVSEQTADYALLSAFDYLRRAHGYLDIKLEGPMGAERITTTFFDRAVMSASTAITTSSPIDLRYEGFVSIHGIIDDGAGGVPTDAPTGSFELWCSSDGAAFTLYQSSLVVTEMAKLAAVGNALVSAFAIFTGMPGQFLKIRYNRASGGTGNSRMTVKVTAW
jgi:uncharacterized protein YmfQ (DUF2313 family)